MKRKLLLAGILCLFGINSVYAETIDVSNPTLLQAYFSTGADVRLTRDITLTSNTDINADTTFIIDNKIINPITLDNIGTYIFTLITSIIGLIIVGSIQRVLYLLHYDK